MSATVDELNIREQIVRIDRAIAESHKFAAEQSKLSAEQSKLSAEQNKLFQEAAKLRRDRWLAPLVVIFAGLSGLGAGLGLTLQTVLFHHP